MTSISDIDEDVINRNLQKRYSANHIYVSFLLFVMKKINTFFIDPKKKIYIKTSYENVIWKSSNRLV